VKFWIPSLVVLTMVAAGCANKKKTTEPSASITDINAPSAPMYSSTPVTAPQPPQPPMYSDASVTSTPTSYAPAASTATGSGNYTVKKGDTLYSIARSRYGDGKQYTRIVSANPGLSPEKLRVGQTIQIP
jgi:nucleoid-associated protein YgaU